MSTQCCKCKHRFQHAHWLRDGLCGHCRGLLVVEAKPALWYLIRQNYVDAVTGEARRAMFPSSNLPVSDAYPIEVIGQFTWNECQERMRAWLESV